MGKFLYGVVTGVLGFLLLNTALFAAGEKPEKTGQAVSPAMVAFVDSLLEEMTLEEKCGQLTQYRWFWGESEEGKRAEFRRQVRQGAIGSFLGLHGVARSREMQRIAVEESRLKIPLLFAHDVIHGWRTTFPVPLAEAASWNPAIAEKSARIAAIEATAAGLHWTFAPMVDIARDPRWGRIVEGSGEDPYLGAVLAAARVRGFQGQDLRDPATMLACAKHFAAYGAAEGGRDYNVADISRRTLREIYLPPFYAAVKAGVGSIMGAFNEVAGVPMHANEYLMNQVLRREWGFTGLVVSDYTAIMELQHHGVAATPADAGLAALTAGVDVDMVSGIFQSDLPELVRRGQIEEALVDQAVRRVLQAKYQLGLFQDPYRYHSEERETRRILTEEHLAAAREVARQSIVLLKNEGNLLPLAKNPGTLAVIGALAMDSLSQLGAWKAEGRPQDATSVLTGIRRAVAPGTQLKYLPGYDIPSFECKDGYDDAVQLARTANVVILILGETANMSGEASNRAAIELPGDQVELAKRLQATGTPIVVVLMNGRPLAIPWLAEHIPAIVEGWFLGSQMGPALADVLFGDVNPSGKLPVTFPRATGQIPIYYNHKNTGRPPDENNFYTSKYLDVPWTPQYPFGWGLSYTTFSYSPPELSTDRIHPDDTLHVTVTVTNQGPRDGEEVVQCYLRDVVASVTRPVKQLRGFQRIALSPGESKAVTFSLTREDLAFYNQQMDRVVEPGEFHVFVGGNSVNVQQAVFWVEGK